jgi:predicted dehydrogenase
VAIFTQRWLHGPQAVQALRAGKHVYSAVPAAFTLEELGALVSAVEETGLVYMLGETSYYRPQTIYCRDRFRKGDFGEFVYGEGQYYHDLSHWFYEAFMHTAGENWRPTGSVPPMLYPTHSVSHVLSVTFARMTAAACFGFVDRHPDGVFRKDVSMWGNEFSCESGLFRTSDGGMARINEFRRTGAGESRMTIIGTLGAYEEQAETGVWNSLDRLAVRETEEQFRDLLEYVKAGWKGTHHNPKGLTENVSDIRDCNGVEIAAKNRGSLPRSYIGKVHLGASRMHAVERLPKEFVGLPNGHAGSHQFLVVDFVEALKTGKLPPNNVWLSARYNAPGIVAHESAMRGGEMMEIPDYGTPPTSWELMDPNTVLK